MAEDITEATAAATSAKRRRWRIGYIIAGLVTALLLIFASGIVWLDSNSGHRFLINRIAQVAPESGLRISIGRIEGSIYRKAVLRDVKLYDPKGLFLSAPEIRLDWWPVSWLSNRLSIDDLNIPTARLYRVWRFNPSKAPSGKILPDFDIRIMRLKVGQLEVDKAVTGRADVFAIDGDADIRDGRALVDLSARALRGKDRLLLALDSRPDNNRFDVDLTVNAPKGGLLAAMAGLQQDANLRLEGDGDWALWKGRLVATLDGQSAAGLAIEQRKGDYHLEGSVAGSAIASKGLLARLSSPNLTLKADGHFEKRLLSGRFQAKSDAIVVDVKGGIHLGGRGYDNLLIDIGLSKPAALLKNFSASGLIARLRLDGPMNNVRFGYLLLADRLQFDKTILRGVNAMGEGRSDGSTGVTQIPLALSAKAIEGQGDLVSTILRNASITGTLQKRGDIITSGPLRLRSDKLNGQLVALFDLKSGRYDFGLTGDIKGLLIPGLGIVDVSSRVKAVPGRGGAFSLTGIVGADVRRLDNAFFRTLGGGLPRLKSDIALGADGRLVLRNLTLRAPLLQFSGEGVRNPDGTIRITGKGVHKSYGPLRIDLSGALDRPKVDLVLARPFDAAGLADVHAVLEPYADGYHFTAQGQSTLGPFSGNGNILLPRGGNAVIDVQKLAVGGVEGKGRIEVVTRGLAGRIDFTGAATGPVELSVVNGLQAIKADFRFRQARFTGATPIEINRGRLQSNILLDPAGVKMGVNFRGGGITVGGARINRMTIDADLVNGAGKVNASLSGQRGRLFDLQLAADVAPDDIRATIRGTLDRQPISLDRRAHLRRVEGGWSLDPVAIRYRGGEARILSATFGHETRVDLGLKSLSLSLLDITNSDLGLGGMISGRVTYSQVSGGPPTGSAAVRITSLTRSGTTRTSTPVDVGLNAELNADRLAMRALISQKGTIIGKAQALLSPLGSGGLIERLRAAPVRAQIRYVGPADALWRLSTIEIVDVTGPIAATANITGTGANPVISGALKTENVTMESPITGMRLTRLKSMARFDGSRLIFSQIEGSTKNGGKVSGRGVFDLSLGQGVGINLALQAENAEMLDRDDIGATVIGPVRITSNGIGGTISGDFDVVKSRFSLGRAAAVAAIPELRVIEKNARPDDFQRAPRTAAWQLDMKARARNRLTVSGMGLNSEWRMDLDIKGNVENPQLLGRADLVRGTYDFAGRRFDLQNGTLRFTGEVPANPTLDITAKADVQDLSATIHIGGTSTAPEISFTSTPALPQDELLSRLLFGSSITQLSAPEALQLAAAVGSLQGGGGGGLDPINAVRKAAGLDRLRILPADPTTGQGTSIAVGKYITRKIYAELITDGQGYSATRLEYQVTRWLSLLSTISTLGRQSVTARVSRDY